MDSENTQTVLFGLSAIGGIALLRYVYSVLSFLYSTFLSGGVNVKKLGSWAVVTVCLLLRLFHLRMSLLTTYAYFNRREQLMESVRRLLKSLPSVISTLSWCPVPPSGKLRTYKDRSYVFLNQCSG